MPGFCIFFLLQNITHWTHFTSQLFLSVFPLIDACLSESHFYFSEDTPSLELYMKGHPDMTHVYDRDHHWPMTMFPPDHWSSLVSGHSGPGHPMCQLVTRDTGHYEAQVRSVTLTTLTIHRHHYNGAKFSDHSPLSLSSLLITNWSLYTRPGPALYSQQLDHFTRGDVLMDTRNRPEQTVQSLYP